MVNKFPELAPARPASSVKLWVTQGYALIEPDIPIFGDTGGRRIAEEYGVPLLAQLPLDPETRVAGDEGTPITLRQPGSAQAAAFRALAEAVAERVEAIGAMGQLPRIS